MAHSDHPRLNKKAFSVVRLSESDDAAEYWRNKTPEERLRAQEIQRQIACGYTHATARLKRVVEIIKREVR